MVEIIKQITGVANVLNEITPFIEYNERNGVYFVRNGFNILVDSVGFQRVSFICNPSEDRRMKDLIKRQTIDICLNGHYTKFYNDKPITVKIVEVSTNG
jgi:hypothetical protein